MILHLNFFFYLQFKFTTLCLITASGNHKLLGLACDVTDEEKVSATLAQVAESVGPISVLVNAAGINEDQLLVKSSAENIRHLLDVNLVGSMVTCKAAVRGMMQRRAGCIINIGIGSRFKLYFFFFFFFIESVSCNTRPSNGVTYDFQPIIHSNSSSSSLLSIISI